jgi:N-acetylmuramoyl-L-alanine amidase
VLIELGFLSNEADERLLLSPEYRDLMVASIVKGIDRFRAGE